MAATPGLAEAKQSGPLAAAWLAQSDLGVLYTVGAAAGEALPEQLAEAEETPPSLVGTWPLAE
ncbi:TPA: hypothetical protein ACH3X1_014792 [Trebouxia sp. C0004]